MATIVTRSGKGSPLTNAEVDANFTNLNAEAATKAPLASPVFTGVASFPDGSAAAPSVTNTGDTNTGMFFPAADTIAFSEGGVEAVRITSAGLIGIGTTSPAAQLHVAGTTTNTAQFTASISGTTLDVTAVTSGTIAVGDIVYGANVSPLTQITALGTGTGGIGTYTVSVSQTAAAATTFTASGSSSTIRIGETDTVVQIGQPTGTLEFSGADTTAPGAGIGAYVSAIAESTSPDTALTFGTRDDAGGGVDANERMRITSVGRVGIGTTTPTATLDVAGTGAVKVPVGTEAERPTPATGMFRFNSDVTKFEGYTGSAWGSVGGGATGGGSDEIFIENGQTVTTNYTITTNKNAMSTGPITVNSGITVTVPSGSNWVIL